MGNEYLINKVLEDAIARFQDAKSKKNDLDETSEEREQHQQEYDVVQEELANLFYLLSENIIRAFGFKLIDKDDALQEGVMICLQKLDQFKPERGKAFNYYTTCTLNHFRQLYRGAKNQHELQKRYYEFLIDSMDSLVRDHSANGQLRGTYKDSITQRRSGGSSA